VCKGRDAVNSKLYILKQIRPSSDKNGFPVSALREISVLFSIPKHENAIHLKEVVRSVNNDRFYLVMEYIDNDLLHMVEIML